MKCRICDICGKPAKAYGSLKIREKCRRSSDDILLDGPYWKRLDVCSRCADDIWEYLVKKEEGRQQ